MHSDQDFCPCSPETGVSISSISIGIDMDSASITIDNDSSLDISPPNSVHAVVPWIHIPHSPVEVCCRMQGLASGYWLFKLSCARTVFWV